MSDNDNNMALLGEVVVNDTMDGEFRSRIEGGCDFVQDKHGLHSRMS